MRGERTAIVLWFLRGVNFVTDSGSVTKNRTRVLTRKRRARSARGVWGDKFPPRRPRVSGAHAVRFLRA